MKYVLYGLTAAAAVLFLLSHNWGGAIWACNAGGWMFLAHNGGVQY